jgi:hypothetical protein
VFFGTPQDRAVTLYGYDNGVDAVSAVFMHQYTMNEYNIQNRTKASSEWVITFPTKNWYVDPLKTGLYETWIPKVGDPGCGGWEPGDDYPLWSPSGDEDGTSTNKPTGWEQCTYVEIEVPNAPLAPFTSVFDGEACEVFDMKIYDREENAGEGQGPGGPIVSPRPPGGSTPDNPNEICYEVNVLRFGNDGVFRPVFGTDSDLLKTVDTGFVTYDNGSMSKPKDAGWAWMDWGFDDDHVDDKGLVGLPVTGFWALQFTNGYLGTPEASVLANYGGLFQHKGNVKRVRPPCGGYRHNYCSSD